MARTVVKRKKKASPTPTDMDTGEWVDIDILQTFHRNPRKGDVEKVAESLKAHGQIKSIGVNRGTETGRENEILFGNHTYLAAKKLGKKKIWVKWYDVGETKAKQIVVADNGSSDGSTYDDQILAEILSEIKEDKGSLVGTTYTDDILGKLVSNVVDDEHGDIDKVEDADDTMSGVEELNNFVFFPSDLDYDIPPLLPNMIPDEPPEPMKVWAGHELDGKDIIGEEEWGETWWLSMWHAGSRGINWKHAIPYFYCVDEATEALTKRGWVNGFEISEDDEILSMRPDGVMAWSEISSVFRKQYDGKMHRLTKNNIDALVTPGHKFPVTDGSLVPVEELNSHSVLRAFGEAEESDVEVYSDSFVELVGWVATEGTYFVSQSKTGRGNGRDVSGISVCQNPGVNSDRIAELLKRCGVKISKNTNKTDRYYFSGPVAKKIREVAVGPRKVLSMDFILSLSESQRHLLINTMVSGDGWISSGSETRCYTQKDLAHTEAFVSLCTLAGIPTSTQQREWETGFGHADMWIVNLKVEKTAHVRNVDFHGGRGDGRKGEVNTPTEDYSGLVWCPSTEYGTFVCRRNGIVYVTGNTDDFHFEPVFNDPAKNTKKILNLGIKYVIMPNYTIYPEMPTALWVYAAYRSFFVARYFQEAGIQVIPDIQTGMDDAVMDVSLLGIPEGCGVVATQAQMSKGDKNAIRKKARLLKEAEDRLGFKNIIVYGHTDADDVVEYADFSANVIRITARTARRREYLNSGATVNSQKVTTKRKRKK